MSVQAAVCAGVVVAWRSGQQAAAVLVPVLGVLVLRSVLLRLHRATEVDALQRLRDATRPVRQLDPAPAAAALLERAAALFGVHAAQLVLGDPDGSSVRAWVWEEGVTEVEPGSVLRGHVLSRDLHEPDGRPLGRLDLQFPRPAQLSPAEGQVLEAFLATASHAASACRELLRREASARVDAATGLGNRADLERRVQELLDGAPVALLLFGLEGSRRVTATFGELTNERMLLEVAGRLGGALRPGDRALRVGNHDFAVLLHLPPGEEESSAAACSRRLLEALDVPLQVDGYELPLEARLGTAFGRGGRVTADELLRDADVALAEAQRRGVMQVVHSGSEADDSVQLLGQLQNGLRLGEIEVHYQPLYDLHRGRLAGAEALVRWRHPALGLLPPGRFVPLVEQTRLILPLTLEVLDQAVAQAVQWRSEFGRPLGVAVNVSPRCLLRPDLPTEVLRVLALHGLPAHLLTLEITETLALTDLPQVDEALRALRDAGVRVSLDDFGTGFSSMSTLRRVVVDEVKIDRSFISGATENAGDLAVVEATVTLARGLGLPVVAEGIETAEQLALARRLGCEQAQGYLLGRPSPRLRDRAHVLAPPTPVRLP